MTVWLRWLGIIPAAVAGWFLAFFIGHRVLGIVDSLCPPEEIVSGDCVAPWYPLASQITICFGVGLSAVLVVAFATLVAPSHRQVVAWVSYGLGASVALAMSGFASPGMIPELLSALGGGLLAALVAHRLAR